jgi:pyruvate dehydrogenase (quinone)
MANSVGDDLVRLLVQAGLTRIYGPAGVTRIYQPAGESLNALTGASRRSGGVAGGGIDWVQVDNEEAAAFAAWAGAQSTGRLAVRAGSCGPGNARLVQGLMGAHRPGTPVLALGSCAAARQIGAGFGRNCRAAVLLRQAGPCCGLVSVQDQPSRRTRLAMRAAAPATRSFSQANY